jgi:hypothetical protein
MAGDDASVVASRYRPISAAGRERHPGLGAVGDALARNTRIAGRGGGRPDAARFSTIVPPRGGARRIAPALEARSRTTRPSW